MNKLSEDIQNICDPQLAVPDVLFVVFCTCFYQTIWRICWQMQQKFLVLELSIEVDFHLCPTEIYYWQAILIRSDMTSTVEV